MFKFHNKTNILKILPKMMKKQINTKIIVNINNINHNNFNKILIQLFNQIHITMILKYFKNQQRK